MEAILNLMTHFPIIKLKERAVDDSAKIDIMQRLKETHIRLNAMRCAFECETDFDLIDIYILEIDSLERQYSYLIKRAKQEHIAAF